MGHHRAGAVSVHITRHVVGLVQHVLAHLVEGRRRNQVAFAVNVPRDGAVFRADLQIAGAKAGWGEHGDGVEGESANARRASPHGVVPRGARGRARVCGDLHAHVAVGSRRAGAGQDHHAANQVGVVVVLIIDDSEDLALHADLTREAQGVVVAANGSKPKFALAWVRLLAEAAEDTVVERGLVLVLGVAGTHLGMWPVNLVGLADHHVLAVP